MLYNLLLEKLYMLMFLQTLVPISAQYVLIVYIDVYIDVAIDIDVDNSMY
jgi:hypothetical protein